MNKEINNAMNSFNDILKQLQNDGNQTSCGENAGGSKELEEQYANYANLFKQLEDQIKDVNLNGLMAGKDHSLFKKSKKTYNLKKIEKKKISKFERIILSYIDKFYVKGGISRTYKRQHRVLENLKGRQHKKHGFKNVQIFCDYSGSMWGYKVNKLRDAFYSIDKTLRRRRMIGFYYAFNTNINGPYNYKKFVEEGYEPSGGTNINKVLKELDNTYYNIIITDAEDNINFDLIESDVKILWFIIGNNQNVSGHENKNIKIINLP